MNRATAGPTEPRFRRRSGRRHRGRWGRLALCGLALGVLLGSYLITTFVQVWQASGRDDRRNADAIVVLGAAQYNGRPSPALRNRLDHALELYRADLAPLVVVTGGRQQGDRFTEATTGYIYLRDRGVPDGSIRKEVHGRTTYESLAAVARFLGKEGIHDVVLVSGPAHSKRLSDIARSVGLRAAVSPSGGSPSVRSLMRETVAVSTGRVIGYRRMERLDR
ncbi:MAG: YdcF family protein [Aquihabitans sp.]